MTYRCLLIVRQCVIGHAWLNFIKILISFKRTPQTEKFVHKMFEICSSVFHIETSLCRLALSQKGLLGSSSPQEGLFGAYITPTTQEGGYLAHIIIDLHHPKKGYLALHHPKKGYLALHHPKKGYLALHHPKKGYLALHHPKKGYLALHHPKKGYLALQHLKTNSNFTLLKHVICK